MSRRRLRILAVTGTAAILLLFVSDLVVGAVIRAKITQAAQRRLHVDPTVTLGGPPALLDVLDERIPRVGIHADHVSTCKLTDASISARLHNLSRHDGRISVSSSQANVILPPQTLSAAIARRLPDVAVSTDPAAGTVNLYAGPRQALEVQLRPKLSGDTVAFGVANVSVLGYPAPSIITDHIRRKIHWQRELRHLPLDLSPTGVSVSADGVVVSLTGGQWIGRPNRTSQQVGCASARNG